MDVPNVKGKSWPEAQQALSDLKLKPVERIVPGPTKGQVTATDPPAGESIPEGSTVKVNVMSGPVTKPVPNVVGESIDVATANLHAAGFNPNPTYVDSDAPQGQVIHQTPAPGTSAREGSNVALQVSNGPPKVDVPSVVGETAQQAVSSLESQGFQVNQQFVAVSDPTQDGIVQSQNPEGGQQATKGSTVTIEIGQSSPPPPTTSTTTTTD